MNEEKQGAGVPGKDKTGLIIGLSLGGFALVVLAFVLGVYWSGQRNVVVVPDQPVAIDDPALDDEVPPDAAAADEQVASHQLVIDWLPLKDQIEIDGLIAFEDVYFDTGSIDHMSEKMGLTAFRLGNVTAGKYEGYEFQMNIIGLEGMGTFYNSFYTLEGPSGDFVLIDRYALVNGVFTLASENKRATDRLSVEQLDALGDSVTVDAGAYIEEFTQDNFIEDTDGRKFALLGFGHSISFPDEFQSNPTGVSTTLTNGKVLELYRLDEGVTSRMSEMFYYVREDGRVVWYQNRISFWPAGGSSVGVPAITWNDSGTNTEQYMSGISGGCGFTTLLNVISRDEALPMIAAGTHKSDRYVDNVLYAPDLSIYATENDAPEEVKNMYDNWVLWSEGTTWEAFQQIHPYFYYTDSFGRLIQFTNAAYLGGAECGKPVIYLYPEETTEISVEVEPQGGFSITIPDYNDGWTVTAHPDGTLENHGDGEVYPYLFWEGRGGLYVSPENYWVVARDDVESFLVDTLRELGLNDQETADFNEFWLPRMEAAAYYKIGFHGTRVMDQLAPMTLSKNPDTYLRILMDYVELGAPIAENPPTLPATPERNGFVVIEWGGVLR